MPAVILWACDCGTHVRALYEVDGATAVRCPKPPCKIKHLVSGRVTQLWVEEAGIWTALEVAPFVSPATA